MSSSLSSSPSPSSPSPDSASPGPDTGFTAQYVKAWGNFLLPVKLQRGERVKWQWKTQAHDLQFGVTFLPAAAAAERKNANAIIVQPIVRVPKPEQLVQFGSYIAMENGALLLNFDNTYSKLRGKNLLYRIAVTSAESDHDAVPLGELRETIYGRATVEGVRKEDSIYSCRLPYGQGYFNASTLLAGKVGTPRTVNQRCMVGVDLFFNNHVAESEAFFQPEVEKFPVFSLAYGSLGFLRALMTWDKDDIASANLRLKQTRNFVSALLPQVSTMKSVGRFLARSSGPQLTVEQLELTLIQAEAYLLQAMLLFTEESYMSYIKAGLRIRSAWKLYERCDEQIKQYDETTRAALDVSVTGGIKFGLGCFNTVISILPGIILRVVSALGFPSDRSLGLKYLSECAAVPGLRQPLSRLVLLFVNVVIPSFFTVRPEYHSAEAATVLADAFEEYPNGALFLWIQGRQNRSLRDLPASVSSFRRSAVGQPAWLQLQHLCAYELGWSYFFKLEYSKSQQQWKRLEDENTWSKGTFRIAHHAAAISNLWLIPVACVVVIPLLKAFFAYQQAVCVFADTHCLTPNLGESPSAFRARLSSYQDDLAGPILARIEPAIVRKFGGRTISVEQFVAGRANAFLKEGRRPVLPEAELMYLFYGFLQMPDDLLLKMLRRVDDESRNRGSGRDEDIRLLKLVRAAILKGLRRWPEAQALLLSMEQGHNTLDLSQTPPTDKYIVPFARFELASLLMEQVVEKDAVIDSGKGIASIDLPLPHIKDFFHDASSSSSSSSSPPPTPISAAAWETERLRVLDHAAALIKRAESQSGDYIFKNRLHLRSHLASVELLMLRKHWEELHGNVQNDEDLQATTDDDHRRAELSPADQKADFSDDDEAAED